MVIPQDEVGDVPVDLRRVVRHVHEHLTHFAHGDVRQVPREVCEHLHHLLCESRVTLPIVNNQSQTQLKTEMCDTRNTLQKHIKI